MAKPENNKNIRLIVDVYEWAESIITAVIAIVLIFTFVARVTSVDGSSMYPTLRDKDRMLAANLFYTPRRNDIVVIHAKGLYDDAKGVMGKPIIKRVIGLPGDVIELDTDEGVVIVNGSPLAIDESDGLNIYEDGHLINSRTYSRHDVRGPVTVPDGCIFVMGDNRESSLDSRFMNEGRDYVGMVDINYVVGRAFFRIAPFADFGFVK